MRTIPVLNAAVVLAFVAVPPVRAQDAAGIAGCRSIADGGERLSCYDKLVDSAQQAPRPTAGRGHQAKSLTDVKLDQDSLRGRPVEVSGNLVVMGQMAMLRSDAMDTSPLLVDFDAVPREQRRAMLERCGMLGCAATIRGKVERVMAQPGIVAETLEVR